MRKLSIPDEAYGPLLPFIKDEFITDINYSRMLWVDHLYKGRYCVESVDISKAFLEQFYTRLSNMMNASFNKSNPLLEAETENLRISILHDSVTNTGISLSIRKTPADRKLSDERMLADSYCPDYVLTFLENCVKAHMNIIVGGLVGTGKTELVKYLTKFIPPYERVWTIEDTLEIRYAQINPFKDCVEVKVEDRFDYPTALKASKRQLPKWVLVSEVRGTEVKYLMENMSAGVYCMSTIHVDHLERLPDRLKNMGANIIDCDIYSFVDIGILLESKITKQGIRRYISQIMTYSRINEINDKVMLYDEGMKTKNNVPDDIMRKFLKEDITNPWLKTVL